MQERHNPKVSWIAWFVLLSAFLAMRVIGKPEIELGRDYMLCAWIPLMFINFYTGHKLIAYLKNHHTKKWEELTTVGGGGGPGLNNSFAFIPWLYSSDDLNDKTVASLKSEHRSIVKLVITVFITLPLCLILLELKRT